MADLMCSCKPHGYTFKWLQLWHYFWNSSCVQLHEQPNPATSADSALKRPKLADGVAPSLFAFGGSRFYKWANSESQSSQGCVLCIQVTACMGVDQAFHGIFCWFWCSQMSPDAPCSSSLLTQENTRLLVADCWIGFVSGQPCFLIDHSRG
jgi:hypothetical protein